MEIVLRLRTAMLIVSSCYFATFIAAREPPINDDTELKEWSIKQLKDQRYS